MAAVDDLREQAIETGLMNDPVDYDRQSRRNRRRDHDPDGRATAPTTRSVAALTALRDELIPATLGQVEGADTYVTGMTAGSQDFDEQMSELAPLVFAFVLGLAFLLLMVTFRSIVIALKAIVLNLLSVGAAYGVLVWVFQDGHGESLLDFESNGGITSWLPLFLFVLLFGLSMDYHVFILSRIREAFDSGMSTERRHRARDQVDRRRGHERRGGDGRGVLDLRHARRARLQADGSRARGRGPDRRDDRPRGAAAGDDEAARRLELVPAELARLAARVEHEPEPEAAAA